MSSDTSLTTLKKAGTIAILRGDLEQYAVDIAGALIEGGVHVLEVTLNSPGALRMIETLSTTYGARALVGAGTVLTVQQLKNAASAGARFVVSPDTFPELIDQALVADIEPLPGAFTPTEVRMALRAGARLIKLFPALPAGPTYLQQLRAPLEDVNFVPTGGITLSNGEAFMAAGAVTLGVGSSLIGNDFGSPDAFDNLLGRAQQFSKLTKVS